MYLCVSFPPCFKMKFASNKRIIIAKCATESLSCDWTFFGTEKCMSKKAVMYGCLQRFLKVSSVAKTYKRIYPLQDTTTMASIKELKNNWSRSYVLVLLLQMWRKIVGLKAWFGSKEHALSTYVKRGRGGVLLLRTPLHKCDVTYVVSLAYKGGGGVKKSWNFAYVLCARPLTFKAPLNPK